jgi:Alw26I/Eco31I/Esp3I family type II restriction endonuclease
MVREKRNWHSDFVKYTNFIAKHTTYRDMPQLYKQDGCVQWITSASSVLGKERFQWWDNKRKELKISPVKGSLRETARKIHPTGEKPCQICGRVLSLDYVYPNKNILKKIHDIENLEVSFSQTDHIKDIIKVIFNELGVEGLTSLKISISIPKEIKENVDEIFNYIIKNKITLLGPGVMSDAPDRLEGFHTYNRCCRHIHDKGRSKENLSKYGEDRRVFQFWSDGDWKAADRLMKVFSKHGVSPDHVGPISLGFCHRPSFDPTTLKDNINKRNRLGISDVQKLLKDEKNESVVSWHTKKVWDRIKGKIKTESQANELGKVMRKNVNQILYILYEIKESGNGDFLEKYFLHPEYAEFDIDFKGFDPETGEYEKMIKKKGTKKQYKNNSERYVDKSLKFLDSYKNKTNRRIQLWKDDKIEEMMKEILKLLKQKQFDAARKKLDMILVILSKHAEKEWMEQI